MLQASLPPPVLPATANYCLFLEFDGTLVDFPPTPDSVPRDAGLVALLANTWQLLSGAVAIVSSRQIHKIDSLLSPLRIPVAGIHGFERRAANGITYRPLHDSSRLCTLRDQLAEFVLRQPGLVLEDKTAAVAVHYRKVPRLATVVAGFMHDLVQGQTGEFELQERNACFEIKFVTHNKATAVEAFMQEPPFANRVPIFIGDDTTARDGFQATERHGGVAIAVGSHVSTPWRLRDPAAVRAWLLDFNTHSVM
jgi:trehalose 6-phosphate phosphatase